MRKLNSSVLAALVLGVATSPVLAADPAPAPAAPAAKPAFTTADTDIGTLLDTPAAKAILDKLLPGFSSNEQVAMARGMTMRAVQQFAPDRITTEALDQIDAELAKLPAK
jgi:hypothetical protein